MKWFYKLENSSKVRCVVTQPNVNALVWETASTICCRGGNNMTANQISYARQREEARHNRVSERHEHRDVESRRISALAADSQAATASARLAEDTRHNQEGERINWFATQEEAQERRRHNMTTEGTELFKAQTDRESKLGQLLVSQRQVATQERQATSREREVGVQERQLELNRRDTQSRATQAYASLLGAQASGLNAQASMQQASAALKQAETAQMREFTNQSALSESIRHSKAVEMETARANRTKEQEVARHNVQQEAIDVMKANAAETQAGAAKIRAYAQALGVTFDIAKNIAAAYAAGGLS